MLLNSSIYVTSRLHFCLPPRRYFMHLLSRSLPRANFRVYLILFLSNVLDFFSCLSHSFTTCVFLSLHSTPPCHHFWLRRFLRHVSAFFRDSIFRLSPSSVCLCLALLSLVGFSTALLSSLAALSFYHISFDPHFVF